MGYSCLPPERVKLTMNSKKERSGRVKMGPRLKIGYSCLLPDRVELTVNSKKETNGRVKMSQCNHLFIIHYIKL